MRTVHMLVLLCLAVAVLPSQAVGTRPDRAFPGVANHDGAHIDGAPLDMAGSANSLSALPDYSVHESESARFQPREGRFHALVRRAFDALRQARADIGRTSTQTLDEMEQAACRILHETFAEEMPMTGDLLAKLWSACGSPPSTVASLAAPSAPPAPAAPATPTAPAAPIPATD